MVQREQRGKRHCSWKGWSYLGEPKESGEKASWQKTVVREKLGSEWEISTDISGRIVKDGRIGRIGRKVKDECEKVGNYRSPK